MLRVPQSPGEVIDRLAILELKVARLPDPAARERARSLARELRAAWDDAGLPAPSSLPEAADLAAVNAALWDVEDALRACEAAARFDDAFVAHARSVYRLNDRRAALKAAVDRRLGSDATEPKSYGGAGARRIPAD
jgi:hypothetical protein